MSPLDNNIESRKGKYLTEKERYTIEILLKEKLKPKDIAKRLDRDRRTIEREIQRGMVQMLDYELRYITKYCADAAQRKHEKACRNKGPTIKIGHDHELANHIENKIIKEHYSPDAVIGEIKQEGLTFKTNICTKTLYNYIDKDIFRNISNKDLLIKKNGKPRQYRKTKVALHNLKGSSIEERPKEVEKREEIGHWEMDCVVGKQGGSGETLLVLSERSTRKELIFKIPNKTQKSVIDILDKLERKHKNRFYEIFKTITVDNGPEFLDFNGLEKSIRYKDTKRTKVYYAHPYSSWERGTNENINKMIRRFIPKGTDLKDISHAEVKRIEHWINNYPRRIFKYKSANKMYQQIAA